MKHANKVMNKKLLTMAERGNELEKRYQQRNVHKFIWIYGLFFVSLRAGWVAECYCDRESGEARLRFHLDFVHV